ncbi:hypothetical protein MESS2_300030 [Mesorhizobium metallidurans STM 2683]|uniref:Uncharacterized protein n=1 Tax=Mesorhizobium metallidurans STM 2683 TaxID=1297569 RepID=M5EPQ7_9HYPH|nr:BrnT family toxin [Mesorhizobium metallidurans]CCV06312.1 hypothetical protein MESS2_300030 [Mesorhizobium metallidurans STM 2683]
MKLVWDEIKRQANVSKHGMDFADLEMDFFYAATLLPARGKRFMAIGNIRDRLEILLWRPSDGVFCASGLRRPKHS